MVPCPLSQARAQRLAPMSANVLFESERFGDRPACFQAIRDCVSPDAELLGRFTKQHVADRRGDNARRAPVSRLRGHTSPSAIFRFVVSLIVNTINRRAAGALPHVGKKVLKNLPPVANGYATPAVVVERGVFRILASVAHGRPTAPSRRVFHAVPHVVLAPDPRGGFPLQAPATLKPLSLTAKDGLAWAINDGAALAFHRPLAPRFGNELQATELVIAHGGNVGIRGEKSKMFCSPVSDNEA